MASQRHADAPSGRGVLQERAPGPRLCAGLHAAHRPRQAVGDQRTSGVLHRQHVLAIEIEGRYLEADELSPSTSTSSRAGCVLTATYRCAWRSGARSTASRRSGVLHGLARAASSHAGRRPHLLPARPDAGGDRRVLNFCCTSCAASVSQVQCPIRAKPEKSVGPEDSWVAAEHALLEEALKRAGFHTRSTPVAARSTVPRSI